jgi:hypothetical protein
LVEETGMNDTYVRIWKQAVVVIFKVLSYHLAGKFSINLPFSIIIIIIIVGFRRSILPTSRVICGGGWKVDEILNEWLSSVPSMEFYCYNSLIDGVAS